jgi:hypothetical protein
MKPLSLKMPLLPFRRGEISIATHEAIKAVWHHALHPTSTEQ